MSQTQTGSCPICGAPIYAESPWWSILPPPPIYTCSCTLKQRGTVITTTSTPNTNELNGGNGWREDE